MDRAIQLSSLRFLQKFSVQNHSNKIQIHSNKIQIHSNKIQIHQRGGYFLICLALHNFVQDAQIVCEGLDLLNNLYHNKTIVSMGVNKFNAPDYATAIIGDTIFGLKFVRDLFNRSLVQVRQQTLVDEGSISLEQKQLMMYHKNILQLLFDIIGRLGRWEECIGRFIRDDVEYIALPLQIIGPDMAPSDDTYDAVLLRSNIVENRTSERQHGVVSRDFVNNYKYDMPVTNLYQSRKRSVKTPSYGFANASQPLMQPFGLNSVPYMEQPPEGFQMFSQAAASNAPPLVPLFGQGALVNAPLPPPIVPLPPPIVPLPALMNVPLPPPIVPLPLLDEGDLAAPTTYRPFQMASQLDDLIFMVPNMNDIERLHLYGRDAIPEIVFSNSLLDELKQFIPKIEESPSSDLWEQVTITFARLHPTLLFDIVMNTNLVRKIVLHTNPYEKLILKEISSNFPWRNLDNFSTDYSPSRTTKLVALNRIKQLQGHQRQEPVRERSTLDKIIGLLQEEGVDVHSYGIDKMFHLAEGVSITPYLLMKNKLSRSLDVEQSFYKLFIDKDVARFLICCGVYIEQGTYTEQNLPQNYHILSFPEYDLLRELYLLVQYECRSILNFALREFDRDTRQLIVRQMEQKRVQVIQRVDVIRKEIYNPFFA